MLYDMHEFSMDSFYRQTLAKIYNVLHNSKVFFCTCSGRFGASWAILQIVHQLNKQASPADILKLLKEKWGFPNFNTM